MTRKICEKCGKPITPEEASASCQKMRKAMNDDDPHIFDVWFRDYCDDCSDKFTEEKEKNKNAMSNAG